MKLLRIKAKGLKAGDFNYPLGDVNVWLGENRSGKTTVLEAIELLTTGKPSGDEIPDTNDGVMRLARNGELSLSATIQLDDGSILAPKRTWKRDRRGKVGQKLEGKGWPANCAGVKDRGSHLVGVLGSIVTAWSADKLLSLPDRQLRQKLLEMIPGIDLRTERWLLPDLPQWALPRKDDDALDWVTAALYETNKRKTEADRERRDCEARIEEISDGWQGEKPIEPLQEQLAQLRHEHARAESRRIGEEQIRKLEQQTQEARARIGDIEKPEGTRIRQEAEEARAAAQKTLDETEVQRVELAGLRGKERELLSALERLAGVAPAAQEEFEDAKREKERIASEISDRRGALKAAREEVVRLTDSPFPDCPHCGKALQALVVEQRKEAQKKTREAQEALDGALEQQTQADALANSLLRGASKRRLQDDLTVLRHEIAAHDADVGSVEEEAQRVFDETNRRLADLEKAEVLHSTFAGFEMDLSVARDELEELGETRDPDALIREIRAMEGALEGLGRYNQRAEQLQDNEEQLERIEERLKEFAELKERLEETESSILAETKAWLEERVGKELNSDDRFEVVLRDPRGGLTCRPHLNGVDVTALSGGERVRFKRALACAINAAQAEIKCWRPVIQDGIEAVSASYRENYIKECLASVDGVRASQVLLAGCPDSWPEVEGVTVFRVGGAA